MKLRLAMVVGLMLLWTGSVRAQCTGQYANDPTYSMLIPKDYAAQGSGNEAVTLTISPPDGSQGSHKMTAGAGSDVLYNIKFWNATADLYYSWDGGSRTLWQTNVTNGSSGQLNNIGPAGHILDIYLVGRATKTQDVIHLTITNQAPGIYFSDLLDTNFYWQVITTGGGSSMLTSCQECQAGTTQHCINATHTPYSTISLTNDMSGESQLLNVQSGSVARSNETLSFSASLAISVLPGDTGTISINHKIVCSMDGIIFEQQLPKPKTSPSGGSWNPSMTGELAFTKMSLKVPTHCTPKLDASGKTIGLICDVAYYCSARSSPPDYQPTKLVTYYYTNPASVPTYWMTMSPGTALVFGKNQPGEIAIWYFPVSTAQEVLVGMGLPDPLLLDIFSLAWVSDSSTQDCTKWISGITPWYMPKW